MSTQLSLIDVNGTPTIDVNFADPNINSNPYELFDQLRELGPIVLNSPTNQWLVASYDGVRTVLGDPSRFGPDSEFFLQLYGGYNMEILDKPHHMEVRGIWSHHFERSQLENWGSVIQSIVDDRLDWLIERVRAGEVIDIIPKVARMIPSLVICRMLGIPPEDRPQVTQWIEGMDGMLEAQVDSTERGDRLTQLGIEATHAMAGYLRDQLRQRRETPGEDDLIRMLADAPISRDMAERDQLSSIALLALAGHGNTSKVLANSLVLLAQNPDQRRAILQDPSLLPDGIEEINRVTSPVGAQSRVVRGGPIQIGSVSVPDGARVMSLLTAANRDPARWDNPNQFDIFRERKQNLAFGFGMHSCLGINLARLEIKIWLERLLNRLPEYEIVSNEIEYGTNFIVRGPTKVLVSV